MNHYYKYSTPLNSSPDYAANRMAQILQIITFLAIIATTAASFEAIIVRPSFCGGHCPEGQVCTEQKVVCKKAPCYPVYTCADKADENQTNPCTSTVCPTGHFCVPGNSTGPSYEHSLFALCVPPCWAKKCGNEDTCVMKPGQGGDEAAHCVNFDPNCPEFKVSCASILCAFGNTCINVGCEASCMPSSICPDCM